jgi:hypothetical protein
MINWDKSAELNHCTVDELKMWFEKYPSSGKRIIVICKGCNEEREIYFNAYRELCKCCAMNQESTIEKLRNAANRQWYVPGTRDAHSKIMIEWNKNHPEAGEAHSKMMIEYCNDPEVLDAMSERAIQWHVDHPECAEEHSNRMKEYNKDPEYRKRASEVRIQYIKEHPEFSMRMSEIMIQYYICHPEFGEKMRGGNDIIDHHIIYDHSDPTKNTISMTRSIHMKLHWLFRKHGIEISHINESVSKWRYV